MRHSSIILLSVVLTACQPTASSNQTPVSAADTTASGEHNPVNTSTVPVPGNRVSTTQQAKALVARYVAELPNRQLYVTDSARVSEGGTSYQVQVPRTDWAKRMPSRAAFEVDKATGTVSVRPVK